MKKVEITLFELRHGNRGKLGVYGHGECTKMAVFGDAIKKMFVSEGIDPERIVVTGNPKFDRLFYPGSKNSKEKVCQQWGIPQNNDIIVLFTQYLVEAGIWTPEQRRRFVLAIAQAVEKLPGTQLIIKLHPPHEKESDYHEIIQELSHKPIIIKYTNLPEMINACSLAITVDSTAGLEAMTVGKPLLIVDLQKRSEPSFYMGSGALFAYTVNDILPAMQKALYDEQTYKEMSELASRFVYNQTYLQDGQAAKRIADLITNMVINKHMAVVTR